MVKIALVDDCETFSFIVQKQVNVYNRHAVGQQIELDIFNSPVDFVEFVKDFDICQYDAIIIDIHMPMINGFELYNQIRKSCIDVKVFLVSGTIYKYETFKDYQSIIQKDVFNIRDIIREKECISRFMNSLEIDLYESDTKVLHIGK